jgi:hypothetical protein
MGFLARSILFSLRRSRWSPISPRNGPLVAASSKPIGNRITYRYHELTDRGVPRFPSFVRIN